MLQRFQKLAIGKKLMTINLLIVGLITLLTIISLCIYMYANLKDEFRGDSKTISSLLAESVTSALMFRDIQTAEEILSTMRAVDNVNHAEIYDHDGNLFASYARNYKNFTAPPRFETRRYQNDIRLGELTFDTAFPVNSPSADKEPIGTIALELDLSDSYVDLGYQIAALLLIGLVSAALISVLLSKLQKSITQPLQSLTETMRKVAREGDFSERAILTSQDEIGELANAYNLMVKELSQRELSLNLELKERRRIEDKLTQIAHFDPITNLPNRHSFNGQMEKALLNHKYQLEKFALMFIDLDNFKYVNDTFGHHVGDQMLSIISDRLRSSLRQEDFVARLGGDEFVVLMSNFTDDTQVRITAGKILETLRSPFSFEGHEVFISASIGIAICPDHGNETESLQRRADRAMYHAKNQGKNNFQFYQDELSQSKKNRILIESSLRHSLNNQEMFTYYQPIIDLKSLNIVGFEALVRWIRKDGILIGPDEFIPLAEEIGIINEIGNHVLDQSATQTAEWLERFDQVFIAVNFSSRQFKSGNLSADIVKTLDHAGLPLSHFEMEITESILMENSGISMTLLESMIRQGAGVGIDDFGTGYSSLSYLTSFPISKIKIDKSFINKLPDGKNALAVVNAIISLAKALNLKVVAEGIETAAQLACLKNLGCQYGQGYLFSKAVPAFEATRLLEAHDPFLI